MWAITASPTSTAQDAAGLEAGPQSRFLRTVLYLQDASAELRRDFATTALSNLASAYFAEARLASRSGQDAGLRAWSSTVDRYASQMSLLLDDVELGFPVRLTIEGDNSLAITVGDRTVIVSHPRLNQQSALEQGILMDFCSRQQCEQFQPQQAALEPIPASAAHIKPNWNFTAQGSECSYQGITVRFNSEQSTANARLICEQFLQEVFTLSEELAWQQRHAVVIEWEQLAIQPTPGRPEHMVRLNAAGDSVLVTVPLLHVSPVLLRQLLPWLRQRLDNQLETSIELDAASYGWQKP